MAKETRSELDNKEWAKGTFCRYCNAEITFSKYVINDRTGNKIALNVEDSSIHRCLSDVDDETRIQRTIQHIAFINSRLKTEQLRLVRENKA